MRRKVFKFFVDYEKEEAWLNKMASLGLHCISYSFGQYIFENGTPGEYTYRLQLLGQLPAHPESSAYLEFMEETGVEMVASYFRWVYLRKKTSEGPFELFSDNQSRISHHKKILAMFVPLFAANLVIGFCGLLEKGRTHSLINLGAAALLAIPIFTSAARWTALRKASQIRE